MRKKEKFFLGYYQCKPDEDQEIKLYCFFNREDLNLNSHRLTSVKSFISDPAVEVNRIFNILTNSNIINIDNNSANAARELITNELDNAILFKSNNVFSRVSFFIRIFKIKSQENENLWNLTCVSKLGSNNLSNNQPRIRDLVLSEASVTVPIFDAITTFGTDIYSWYGNTVDEVIRAQFSGGPVVFYQDQAGTVPVTAVGQDIGLVLDLSGNGKHLRLLVDEYIDLPKLFQINGKYAMGTTDYFEFVGAGTSSVPTPEYSISLRFDPNGQGYFLGVGPDYTLGDNYYHYFTHNNYQWPGGGGSSNTIGWSDPSVANSYIETNIPSGTEPRVMTSSSTFVDGERRFFLYTGNNLTFTPPAGTVPADFLLHRLSFFYGAGPIAPAPVSGPVLLTSLPLIIKRSITDFERAQIVEAFA
jgi:hypothetical protein